MALNTSKCNHLTPLHFKALGMCGAITSDLLVVCSLIVKSNALLYCCSQRMVRVAPIFHVKIAV